MAEVTWIPEAEFALMGDAAAANLAKNDTLLRKEIREQSQIAIGDSPDVTAAATEKVNEVVAQVGIVRTDAATPTTDGDALVIRNKDGGDTWLQANNLGLPTNEAMSALASRGAVISGPEVPFVYPGKAALWFDTVAQQFNLVEG